VWFKLKIETKMRKWKYVSKIKTVIIYVLDISFKGELIQNKSKNG
jgi:uncharacterized protein YlbG (UPF0298 family)